MTRRTKIVATIGPASSDDKTLEALLDAGVDVARMALAHGDIADHVKRIDHLRDLADARGRSIGILVDLPGPKVRTTTIAQDIQLIEGRTIKLSVSREPSTLEHLHSDYANLLHDVRAGDVIGLGDGSVTLQVNQVGDVVEGTVVHGGTLVGRPGIKVPTDRLSVTVPTDDDRVLLDKCLSANVDMVAVSFVRGADDIHRVREIIGDGGPMVVAKIETRAAVDNLDEIIKASDAVMVARGDLGTEVSIEDVPILQKQIIAACLRQACPVITATQMLETMMQAPIPTRAEASDVANAVLDGTDAVMLSGETAIGHDPVLVVETMVRIIERAEQTTNNEAWEQVAVPDKGIGRITSAITHAAWRAAIDADVSAILCCTRSGRTARAMAGYRPRARLIGLSPRAGTRHQLSLVWGVSSLSLPDSEITDEVVSNAVRAARSAGFIADGDVVAVLAGSSDSGARRTDLLRLVKVAG